MVWALEQKDSRRGWDESHEQDVMVPWVMKGGRKQLKNTNETAGESGMQSTYHRYYHLYREGELEDDVLEVGGVVLHSGYEKDNWWAIVGRRTAEWNLGGILETQLKDAADKVPP